MAESHLLFLFWASAGEEKKKNRKQGRSERCQVSDRTINPFMSLRSKGFVGISHDILCDKREPSAD